MWLLTYLVSIGSFMLGVLLIAHILRQNQSPSSTIAWLVIVLLVPYLGVPLYLVFGGRKLRRLASKKRALYPGQVILESAGASAVERLLAAQGVPTASSDNRVRLLGTGEDAFKAVGDLIAEARETIYITTYILGPDEVGRDLVFRLARRAEDGVDVRVVMDAYGSFWARKVIKPLLAAGGRVARFMPMLSLPTKGSFNLRNHRKLMVFDGCKAVVGGMNLAGEYMGPLPDPNRWIDLALLVEGQAARDVEAVFYSDWNFACPAHLRMDVEHRPAIVRPVEAAATVQVVGCGPDVPGDPLYDAFLSLCFKSNERIWIATPYFVPDMALTRALSLAVRRGVDVRILVPNRSNHPLADLARGSYLRKVSEAGGQILRYSARMMHAKMAVFDHQCAIVGSANLDIRSLFLNYELSVFLYSRDDVDVVADWVGQLMMDSASGLPRRGWLGDLGESMGRLLAPLM